MAGIRRDFRWYSSSGGKGTLHPFVLSLNNRHASQRGCTGVRHVGPGMAQMQVVVNLRVHYALSFLRGRRFC